MPKRLTQQQFIDRATQVHGNLYNYSKVKYYNFSTPVEIICSYHGSFFMRPHLHTSNKEKCPKCNSVIKTKTQEQFVAECNKIHNFKYDYSQAVYKGSKQKVTIKCPRHGLFEKIANQHRTGFGCPFCAKRNNGNYKWRSFRETHPDILNSLAQMYLMLFTHKETEYTFYKIGVTRFGTSVRFRGYTKYSKRILHVKSTSLAKCLLYETEVHRQYQHLLTQFDRFEPTFYGKTECYDFTNTEIDNITSTYFT